MEDGQPASTDDATRVPSSSVPERLKEEEQELQQVDSPKGVSWRRLKLTDKERYEDDFVFEVNGKQMVIQQDVANELDTVGLTVWDSSLVMIKFLEKLHHQGRFGKGLTVLELGAGCGPVSVAAAMLGAKATATDVEWILPFTRRNAEKNQEVIEAAGGSIECRPLYWGREADIEGLPCFDFILAADCIYKEKQVVQLLKTMHRLANEKTRILVGYERHNPESSHAFYVHINQYFDTESIPLSQLDPYYQHPKIKLMWLIKREFTPPPLPPEETNWVAATASKKDQRQSD